MKRLFGADGIRGKVDTHPLTVSATERLGRALAAWLRQTVFSPVCLVATDTRESCQRLKGAVVTGLRRGGVRVVDANVVPTAAVSYLIAEKGHFAGGVMISASHSPIEENGIKVFDQNAVKVSDEIEELIEYLFFGERPLPLELKLGGYSAEPTYALDYARDLAREYRDFDWPRIRLVLDCAHGAAYQVAPQVCDALHLPYTLLHAAPNGTNINQSAGTEYVRLAPQRFAQELERHHADIAVAVDGDADRVVLVDRAGHFYDGDTLLALLADRLKATHQLCGNTVVITPMSNSGLPRFLKSKGIHTTSVHNGDKYITDKLLADDFTLGGEEIGHVIIHNRPTRLTGDGLRTALTVLSEWTRTTDVPLWNAVVDLKKVQQIKASIYTGRVGYPTPEAVPGLLDLLACTSEAIGDLVRPIVCRPASTEPVYRIVMESYLTPVNVLARHAQRIGRHLQQKIGCPGRPITIYDCVEGGLIEPPSSGAWLL